LKALAWILADAARAQRFLAVTGLDADGLRAAIGEPATHLAVLDFLCAHEPDLIAAAEALGLTPAALAATRERFAP
jgi:adenine/guanine phosphoribosyltransferase-like PRPP-binding protein